MTASLRGLFIIISALAILGSSVSPTAAIILDLGDFLAPCVGNCGVNTFTDTLPGYGPIRVTAGPTASNTLSRTADNLVGDSEFFVGVVSEQGDDLDEIDELGNESLTIEFLALPVIIDLIELRKLDFFTGAPQRANINGSTFDATNTNGLRTIPNPPLGGPLNMLVFTAPELNTYPDRENDYGVHLVEFTPVPEPGTLLLMACGLAGLAATRRRKKNSSP